jgi:hypothetical protein
VRWWSWIPDPVALVMSMLDSSPDKAAARPRDGIGSSSNASTLATTPVPVKAQP